jgi:hypothetical protein
VEIQLGPRERGCLSIPKSSPLCKGGGEGGFTQKGQRSDAESRRHGSASRGGAGGGVCKQVTYRQCREEQCCDRRHRALGRAGLIRGGDA